MNYNSTMITDTHSISQKDTLIELDEIISHIDRNVKTSSFVCLEELQEWLDNLNWDWEKYTQYQDSTYSRVPLHKCAEFDLLLVCWKPSQGSNYHPHPSQGCLMKVLKGELQEEIKKSNGEVLLSTYSPGATTYICDKIGQHKVSNQSGDFAVSLHIYAPGHYKP